MHALGALARPSVSLPALPVTPTDQYVLSIEESLNKILVWTVSFIRIESNALSSSFYKTTVSG